MTDTSKFRPDVSKLFEPRPPLKHLDDLDYPLSKRRTCHIDGIGSFLEQLKGYTAPQKAPTENTAEQQLQEAKEHEKEHKITENIRKLDDEFQKWKPDEDPNIKGDPFKTVFVARLDYSITEVDLQREFTKFGEVERVRIVRDKTDGKSRGYAFVVFSDEHGARAAYKEGNGMKLGDRTILTDVERARTNKNWVPRRLGGGLGGRHYLLKQKQREESERKKAEMYASKMKAPPRFAGRGRGGGSSGVHERPKYEPRGGDRAHDSRGHSDRGYEPRSSRPYADSRHERSYESRNERSYESRNERSIGYRSSQDRYSSRSERSDYRDRDRYKYQR